MAIATISIAIIVCVLSPNGQCENIEKGLPFIQSFTPGQYGALGQNTDIVQDCRSVPTLTVIHLTWFL